MLTLLLALGQCSGLPIGVSQFKLFVMCCEACVSVDIVAVFEQFKRPNAYQLALYPSANFSEKLNVEMLERKGRVVWHPIAGRRITLIAERFAVTP